VGPQPIPKAIAPYGLSLGRRPALVSAVPSIIGRVGFGGFAALKAGVDPGLYTMAGTASSCRHALPAPQLFRC